MLLKEINFSIIVLGVEGLYTVIGVSVEATEGG